VTNPSAEALKPWLGGEAQAEGIVGVGTYKRKYVATRNNDIETPLEES
jgi:hypothetical protein